MELVRRHTDFRAGQCRRRFPRDGHRPRLTSDVALGVAVGLVVGKTLGVSVFSFIAVKAGLGRLPERTGWRHIFFGLAAVAGIGFTVALFVTSLAFRDPALIDLAKVGVGAGSLIAGVVGFALLSRAHGTNAT